MRGVMMIGAFFGALGAAALVGLASEPDVAPGDESAEVIVNSQASLLEIVGVEFRDAAWEYSAELLPKKFPKLTYVSGPGDAGLFPKARWRRPVVLQDETAKVQVQINCYRRCEATPANGVPGTPFAALLEPDYEYGRAEFHGLPAASASRGSRNVFVFCDGDLFFKVEANGGEANVRRATIATATEAIWRFRD